MADAGAAARGRGGAADLGIASGPAYPSPGGQQWSNTSLSSGIPHTFREIPEQTNKFSSPRDRMQKSITVTDPRRVELELERD